MIDYNIKEKKERKKNSLSLHLAQCIARVGFGAAIRVDARCASRLRHVVGTFDRFARAALSFVARRRCVATNYSVEQKSRCFYYYYYYYFAFTSDTHTYPLFKNVCGQSGDAPSQRSSASHSNILFAARQTVSAPNKKSLGQLAPTNFFEARR